MGAPTERSFFDLELHELRDLVLELARALYNTAEADLAHQRDQALRSKGVLKDVKRELFPPRCPRCGRWPVQEGTQHLETELQNVPPTDDSYLLELWKHRCKCCGFEFFTEAKEVS